MISLEVCLFANLLIIFSGPSGVSTNEYKIQYKVLLLPITIGYMHVILSNKDHL